jgi:serine/threonine-protein kinase
MMKDPEWDRLPDDLPGTIRNLVRRCLEKDPRERVRDMGDVRLAMTGAFETETTTVAAPVSPTQRLWQRPVPAVIAVLTAVVLGALAMWSLSPTQPASPVSRTAISVPPSQPVVLSPFSTDVAISPDGRRIVYQTGPGLGVRAVDQLESVALRGLETAFHPFFSPDGAWIAFSSGNTLQRVSSLGGPPVTLSPLSAPLRGASWGPDDVIIFGLAAPDGLQQVPAVGGEPTPLTDSGGQAAHLFPHALPNGAGVLFTVSTSPATTTDDQIAVLDRATGEHRVILETGSSPRYANSGHIVYSVEGVLYAVAFDQESLEVTSDPVPVVENVATKISGAASFDLSNTGALVYVNGSLSPNSREFVWVGQEGDEDVLPLPARAYQDPRVSPDGRRIAVTVAEEAQDLWVYDAVSAAGLRLTQGFLVRTLVWTPDGSRIMFLSGHDSVGNIYSVPADGSGEPELVLASDAADFPTSVTPDGRAVVFSRLPDGGNTPHREIWEVAVDGSEPAVPLLQGDFGRGNAEYSPDGDWLVYRSDQSGTMEVYVQPYPGPGPVVPASIGGGDDVMWSVDGSRLFYRLGDQMMAAPFEASDQARIGTPTVLFQGTYVSQPGGVRQHHIAPDGRFLMLRDAGPAVGDEQVVTQVVLVQNWFQELTERVPIP